MDNDTKKYLLVASAGAVLAVAAWGVWSKFFCNKGKPCCKSDEKKEESKQA